MMNRIKHSALFAILMVPAMAQGSAAADEKGAAEFAANGAGRQYNIKQYKAAQDASEKRIKALLKAPRKKYERLDGHEVSEDEAENAWNEASAFRDGYGYQLQPTKKKKINPLYSWYQHNKALAGALIGGLGFGAVALLANSKDATTNVCIASTGALIGSAVANGKSVGSAALAGGALTGALTGYGAGGNQGAAMGAYYGGVTSGVMAMCCAAYGKPANRWGRGALVGGSIAGAATAIGYGTVCAPLAIPVLFGSLVGGNIADDE